MAIYTMASNKEACGNGRLHSYTRWLEITSLILSHVGRDKKEVSKQAMWVHRERLLGSGSCTCKGPEAEHASYVWRLARRPAWLEWRTCHEGAEEIRVGFGFYNECYHYRDMTHTWQWLTIACSQHSDKEKTGGERDQGGYSRPRGRADDDRNQGSSRSGQGWSSSE